MNMGEKIREQRIKLGLTQDELGEKLVPKVAKSAVTKWETGKVENVKRSHIQQMAKLELHKMDKNGQKFFPAVTEQLKGAKVLRLASTKSAL